MILKKNNKKNVGIITIPDYDNYGNRLQNFAVMYVFKKMGYNTRTLELNDPDYPLYDERRKKIFLRKYRLFGIIFLYNLLHKGCLEAKRSLKFEKFSARYLNIEYHPTWCNSLQSKLNKDFSYFILGSDQIWNPINLKTPNLFFASFTLPSKKVCFSPSFGFTTIPKESENIIKNGLQTIDNISVREETGINIVRDLTGKEAILLIDPTMMIDVETWNSLIKKPKRVKKSRFIVSCFLSGQIPEYKEFIYDIAKENKLDNLCIAEKEYENEYISGPGEFLWYIKNAQLVCTDSFHAVIFSILYSKPFILFPRYNPITKLVSADTRVMNILKKYQFEDRLYSNINMDNVFNCNFKHVKDILDSEREKVYQYFRDCGIKNV